MAWQFLFVIGAWISLDRTDLVRRLIASPPAMWLAVLFLLFRLAVTLAVRFSFSSAMSAPIAGLFLPNDKTNLAPYRILHFPRACAGRREIGATQRDGLKLPLLRPVSSNWFPTRSRFTLSLAFPALL